MIGAEKGGKKWRNMMLLSSAVVPEDCRQRLS
jgi:hypothetical protein